MTRADTMDDGADVRPPPPPAPPPPSPPPPPAVLPGAAGASGLAPATSYAAPGPLAAPALPWDAVAPLLLLLVTAAVPPRAVSMGGMRKRVWTSCEVVVCE